MTENWPDLIDLSSWNDKPEIKVHLNLKKMILLEYQISKRLNCSSWRPTYVDETKVYLLNKLTLTFPSVLLIKASNPKQEGQ
jgi:hypothetical protein